MKVLITGATGLIGKVLIEKFFSTGAKVNFLTTKKSKIHSIKGASGFYWSPAKKILDLKCFDGVDSIIHLAGSRISKPWTKSNKKDILSSRVDSTRLLFLSLKNNIESFNIKNIVSASAIGIYPSEFKKIQRDQYELFCRKQYDYGPQNIAVGTILKTADDIKLSLLGIWFRINDKVERIKTLLMRDGKNSVQDEPITDSFSDVSNYGVMAQVVARGKWAK